MSSSYIVQQPRSLTNPSDKYRVLDFEDWKSYVDRGSAGTLPQVYGEWDTYEQAKEQCDTLNTSTEA